MKKILAIAALALSSTAFAADYASVTLEHVTDRVTNAKSTVEFVRAGKEINGLQFGVQSRTSRADDATGLKHSLEGTVGKNYTVGQFGVTPFVGAGRDLTKNGASEPYTYGVVGVNAGLPVGPGYAMAGVKTRVGSTQDDRTKQTLTYVSYAYPVAKNLAVTAGLARSAQDIKERAINVGVQVGF